MAIFPTASRSAARRSGVSVMIVVLLITVVGLAVRLFQVATADFPKGDGGLFHAFIQDLIAHNLSLPLITSYNGGGIPFAYPPLMFYVGAILNKFANISILDTLRLLPALLNAGAAPAVYLLGRAIGLNLRAGLLAALACALMPGAFASTLSGGGLTRSAGLLLGLLALWQGADLFRNRARMARRERAAHIAAAGVLLALAVMAHPQMGLTTVYSLAIFWAFLGRTRDSLFQLIAILLIGALGSAPWWAGVLIRYGAGPLFAATATGSIATRLVQVITLPLGLGGAEPSFWGFLALLGAVTCIADRRYLLPAWLAAMFLIDTRIPVVYGTAPIALLGAVFLDAGVLGALEQPARRGTAARLARSLLLLVLIGSGLIGALDAGISGISPESRAAMAWIARNTPPDSTFVVFTNGGGGAWFTDALDEWFPELTGRRSLATVQGREWQPDFARASARYESLNACAQKAVTCLEGWAAQNGVAYSHIYINTGGFDAYALRQSLAASGRYLLIHEGPEALIYARQ
jgi:hypothetical protein